MNEIAKQILDKWATCVVPKDAIFIKDGQAQVNQLKCLNYEECKYREDLVLWIAPKDCLRLEFEGSENENHRYILEIESAAKSLGLDYCVTGHKGKSDYFNIFNIKGLPMGEDNQNAKLLFVNLLLPSCAKDQLDRTNLGWTLSPIIEHPHWKPKYNGEIHKILRGKNPLEHNNEYPKELLKQLNKSKKENKKYIVKIKTENNWVEDFLINYCCNNKLPEGSRHFIIEKNLAAFLIHRKDRDEIKQKYYETQKRTHDSLRTWEVAILKGNYTDVSAGELAKFIKDHSLPYELPPISLESEEDYVRTSFINHSNIIAEQIYDKEKNISKFAICENGKIRYEDNLTINGIEYRPLIGDELSKGVVILPIKAEEYESTEKLIQEIHEFSKKYIDISEEFRLLSCWYVLLSWVYQKLNTLNYMRIQGDYGTGKSRYLDTFARISYKCTLLSGATSVAALYRIQGKWGGSLYIEEADIKQSDESNDFIKILNCGFEKNKPVIRCDKNEPNKLEFHDPFGPKWLGTRKTFEDAAIESRCITEISRETDRKDIPPILIEEFYKKQQELINKLLMFRFKNYSIIKASDGLSIDMEDIEPRTKQATASFISMFYNDEKMLNNFKEFLKKYNKKLKEDRSENPDGQIINAIAEIIQDKAFIEEQGDYKIKDIEKIESILISSSDIVNYLVSNCINIKATSRSVGKRLKTLGINTKLIREGKNVQRAVDFSNANVTNQIFKKYIVEAKLLENFVTFVTLLLGTHTIFNNNNEDLSNYQKSENKKSVPASPVTLLQTLHVTKECECCGLKTDYLINGLCEFCRRET